MMGNFRTFTNAPRVPAIGMKPIIDPAGWSPDQLGDVSTWGYQFTENDVDELASAVASFKKSGLPSVEVSRDTFPLGRLATTLADVRRGAQEILWPMLQELADEPQGRDEQQAGRAEAETRRHPRSWSARPLGRILGSVAWPIFRTRRHQRSTHSTFEMLSPRKERPVSAKRSGESLTMHVSAPAFPGAARACSRSSASATVSAVASALSTIATSGPMTRAMVFVSKG